MSGLPPPAHLAASASPGSLRRLSAFRNSVSASLTGHLGWVEFFSAKATRPATMPWYASGPTRPKPIPILEGCLAAGRCALEFRNRLLASLPAEDMALLRRHLREVPVEQGEMLEEPGRSVEAVYFPQTG